MSQNAVGGCTMLLTFVLWLFCYAAESSPGKTVTFCTVFSGNHKSNSCCVSAFAQIDVGRVYARRRSCTCCKWCALCSLQVWWNLIRNGAVSGAHLLLCSLLLRWRANISPLSLGSALCSLLQLLWEWYPSICSVLLLHTVGKHPLHLASSSTGSKPGKPEHWEWKRKRVSEQINPQWSLASRIGSQCCTGQNQQEAVDQNMTGSGLK